MQPKCLQTQIHCRRSHHVLCLIIFNLYLHHDAAGFEIFMTYCALHIPVCVCVCLICARFSLAALQLNRARKFYYSSRLVFGCSSCCDGKRDSGGVFSSGGCWFGRPKVLGELLCVCVCACGFAREMNALALTAPTCSSGEKAEQQNTEPL